MNTISIAKLTILLESIKRLLYLPRMVMISTRCKFCKHIKKDLNPKGMCIECDDQYKHVVAGIMKRYSGALNKLADR